MPRKKSEFKPLTYKGIVKENPERQNLFGEKKETFEAKCMIHSLSISDYLHVVRG